MPLLSPIKIGIIGGTGFRYLSLVDEKKEIEVSTKYGEPSGPMTVGEVGGRRVVIIKRHGKKHVIMPSLINYRANIWALKQQGCTHVITTTAARSLCEDIQPGDIIVPDQLIDCTSDRETSFFDQNEVCHINMSDPFCPQIKVRIKEAIEMIGYGYHAGSTVLVNNGPRYASVAEANYYRMIGADLTNMTMMPEAALAKEAGICYHPIVICAGFDSWTKGRPGSTAKESLKLLKEYSQKGERIIMETILKIDFLECGSCSELDCAILK